MVEVSLAIAFVGGLISFLSPCVLPLIPGFLSFLAGTSLKDIEAGAPQARRKIFLMSIFFVLGFSSIFSLVGVLLNSVLQDVSFAVQVWLGRIGGVLIILFGLYLLGLLKIPWLEKEHKLKARKLKYSYLTAFVFGAAFAVGWTPCVGAVLGTILTLAVASPGSAFNLLLSYSLGLGIPFLVVGLFTGQAARLIGKLGKYLTYFNYVVGVLLLILGVLVFTNNLTLISNFEFLNRLLLR